MKVRINVEVSVGVSPMDVYRILDGIPDALGMALSEPVHLAFEGWDVIFPAGAKVISIKTVLLGIPVDCLSSLLGKVLVFESDNKK